MKVVGSRKKGQVLEFDGKKIPLHKKSYKAGHKAGMKGEPPECVFDFDGCSMSFVAGYVKAMNSLRLSIESYF